MKCKKCGSHNIEFIPILETMKVVADGLECQEKPVCLECGSEEIVLHRVVIEGTIEI